MSLVISWSSKCLRISLSFCSNNFLCSKSCRLSFEYLNISRGVSLRKESLSNIKNRGNAIYPGTFNFFGFPVFLSLIKDKIGGAK